MKKIKKIISLLTIATMFSLLTTTVLAENETETAQWSNGMFELSSNAEDWTIPTDTDGKAVAEISENKEIVSKKFDGRDKVYAQYNKAVPSGDFIITTSYQVNAGGENDITLTAAGIDFRISGTGKLTVLLDGRELATGQAEVSYANEWQWSPGEIIIVYKAVGEVAVYHKKHESGLVKLAEYKNADIANKTGLIKVGYAWSAGKLVIPTMYKSFDGAFFDDFGEEDITPNWDCDTTTFCKGNEGGKNALVLKSGSEVNKLAKIRPVFTTGSYSFSFDYYTWSNNERYVYFNMTGDKAAYSLKFNGIKTDTNQSSISIMKGDTVLATTDYDINSNEWTRVRIDYNSENGRIDVYMKDDDTPTLTATDTSYIMGKIGFKSMWDYNMAITNVSVVTEKDTFKIHDLTIDGKPANGQVISASALAVNTTNADKSAVMILAVYDNKNSRIVDLEMQNYDIIKKHDVKKMSVSANALEGLSTEGDYSIKCFVMDSLANVTPLEKGISK